MPQFQGKVINIKNRSLLSPKEKELYNKRLSDFKEYFFNGFHIGIGKDAQTLYPNPPTGHRHVHLKPISETEILETKNNDYWLTWDVESGKYPTSDIGLFYFVDVDRNAYVFSTRNMFHYYISNNNLFIFEVTTSYNELISKNIQIMKDIHELNNLFDEQWLL
jgi:hypothetical protein